MNYASLVQPYQHHYYVVEQTDFSWLVITFDMLQQDLVRNFPVDCVAVNDFQLICIYRMLQIYLDILKGKTGLDQLLQGMLGNFLREMNLSEGHIDTGNAQEDASKNINMFERINKYIFARISDPNLNINEISKELDISITKLYSIFRLVSECNPGDYIRTQRIRRAIRMLGNTRYSVSEIARLNGFSSLAIFSRSFKNVVGQSPSQYVKDNL
ncbi:MAG: AraC family transcriptional regulator [Lentisphaeria bacterium]|nr:AraC family transcriptional regulator [Lentisphaeria bacterium]